MRLHLTDGTVLVVDDGPFIVEPDGAVLFMSEGCPIVIGGEFPAVLIDGDENVCWEFA